MNRGFARRPLYIATACGRSSRSSVSDELEEPPGGRTRVGRRAHRGDDRHTIGARAHDVGDVVVRDAADPYEWNADLAPEFPDQRGTDELEVRLGRRREHRADRDIVGAVVARGSCLFDVV